MAKNSYKRSGVAPQPMTEEHKKALGGFNTTSSIIRYALIVVVLLSILFSMLAVFRIDVVNEQLDTIAGGKDKFGNISFFNLIDGWFEKASYSYAPRGINIGYQYPHVFDYLVDKIPALKTAVGVGSIGADPIFKAVTPDKDALLDGAYIAMLVLEIVTLVWLVAMSIIFALTFVKKMAPSQTIINTSIIIHFVLNFIMFVFTLALASNGTKEFFFSVGIGMWLNLLISVVLVSFVIANMIYKAKLKTYETI